MTRRKARSGVFVAMTSWREFPYGLTVRPAYSVWQVSVGSGLAAWPPPERVKVAVAPGAITASSGVLTALTDLLLCVITAPA